MASAGDLDAKFTKAADFFRTYPKGGKIQLSESQSSEYYSLFKISTVGKCNIPSPGDEDLVGKAKWAAWNDKGEMTPEEAKKKYIQALTGLLNEYEKTPEEEELLKSIAL